MELEIFRAMTSYLQSQHLVLGYYCNLFSQYIKIVLCALTDNTAHKNNIIRKYVNIVTPGYIKGVPP